VTTQSIACAAKKCCTFALFFYSIQFSPIQKKRNANKINKLGRICDCVVCAALFGFEVLNGGGGGAGSGEKHAVLPTLQLQKDCPRE
jgi:hypothetical protein